ncbi:MAG: hypothetical protein H6900_06130 [Rhodobacter sp.]|uniref:hypothetical protein n=1 Tax=Pararhodobacter sp. TaxID=2127056 RepID=UPI001D6CC725|nr:hypothetical protein [Pararhodobacter sp.]MCB1345631.1 hypothetical protein [Paracoccaceae bacterium]MCC0072852.1 hypothetical protein [Rhodobacter sp.]HPD92500.1 hypothetical protein [Pararhodobacter sp.]
MRKAPPSSTPLAFWRIGDGAPPAGPFVALAPGADAPLLTLTLPATLKGPAREDVARRQIRDRLGPGLDLRPLGAEGWTRAAVAHRADVLRWRGALGTAAARCRGILPDYLALPTAPGLWSVQAGRDGLVVRLGPEDGFTAEPDLARQMLRQALAGPGPAAVLRLGADAALDALFDGLAQATDPAELPAGIVPRPLAAADLAVDFARDPHADAAGIETRLRRALWPAALVVLGALGWAGSQAVTIRDDRAQAAAIRSETLSAVRRDLLPAGPILDLQVQVTREIDRRTRDARPRAAPLGPLDLLRRAAPVLAEGAQVGTLTLGGDRVQVDVALPDFRALDALIAGLAQAGIRAGTARSGIDAGGVAATLTLEEAP